MAVKMESLKVDLRAVKMGGKMESLKVEMRAY